MQVNIGVLLLIISSSVVGSIGIHAAEQAADPSEQGLIGCALDEAKANGRSHVVIRTVVPGFAAFHAGVQAHDIVLAIDGKSVSEAAEMTALIRGKKPGTWVNLTVLRQNKQMEIKVRVSSRADFEQKGPKSYLGKKAPPLFILARNGNSMNLTDREGKKPLLISIWATWCPACKQALPNLKMLQDKFGGKIEIALITNEPYTLTDEFAKANKAFASISTLNHQVDEGKLHIAYWVDALPTFLILDRQSRLVTVIDGYDPREIQAAVEKAAI